MLSVLGSKRSLCESLGRRDFIKVGALGGLELAAALRLQAAQASVPGRTRLARFGKAKRCILLFLYGAASQLETFDVKPDAPLEVRGELGAIPTRVPSLPICELLPRLAQVMDRVTVIRSMTHAYPIHGVAYTVTSTPTLDIPQQLNPRDQRHWPFVGSAVEYADQRRSGSEAAGTSLHGGVLHNVALPWRLSTRRPNPAINAGPYGAMLGSKYDPVWTEFDGEATKEATYEFGGVVTTCRDPFGGIKPDCRFYLPAQEQTDVRLDRMDRRRSLLTQFDAARRAADAAASTRQFDHFQELAFALIVAPQTRRALDVHQEPVAVREQYGMTLFGQACLAARRLVEAGSRFVTVFWDEFGSVNAAWDTHYQHYPRMKEQLLPGLDQALPTLIRDLEVRGLLDETLVAVVTEHGRSPRLTRANHGGRDHWSRAYCGLLAGGGAAAGKVIGRTDRIGGDVVDNPVSPKDVLATMYHLLGIDPDITFPDRLGRPVRLAGEGQVRPEFF